MFCPTCGNQIQGELNYCNRCGSKVGGPDPAVQKTVADNLSSAVGYIGGFGLLAFIFVIYLLVRSGATSRVLVPISLFYLAAVFGICWLVLRQVAELTKKSHSKPSTNVHDTSQPAYLKPVTTAQLDAPRDMPISVTENTTRTLDEVPIRRN
jgi:uncharacterized membrane protein YvbJ